MRPSQQGRQDGGRVIKLAEKHSPNQAEGRAFEHAVLGVIVANTAVLLAGLMVDDHEAAFEAAHDGFLGFFVVELALRLRAGGWRFLRKPLNAFDTGVIALSCLPVLGVDASLLRLARLARLLHLLRHLPHLRLLRLFVREEPRAVRGAK
jgi:Ion transport protein